MLRDKPGLVRVYIYASREKCIEKEMNRQKIDWKTADKFISKTDKYRRDYYRYFTGQEWENMQNYDLCINTTQMTYERAAKAIQDFAENMLAENKRYREMRGVSQSGLRADCAPGRCSGTPIF